MKNTGIVRRIDELGRIVIPKELRKILALKEGEQLEIYTNDTGELTLKKFQASLYHKSFIDKLCRRLASYTQKTICVCDRHTILSCYGLAKEYLIDDAISNQLATVLESRRKLLAKDAYIKLTQQSPTLSYQQYILPIIANGDLYGGLILLSDFINDKDILLCDLACDFLAMLFEQ